MQVTKLQQEIDEIKEQRNRIKNAQNGRQAADQQMHHQVVPEEKPIIPGSYKMAAKRRLTAQWSTGQTPLNSEPQLVTG